MPSSPAAKVTPISLPGIRVVWPRLLALRLDMLAVVEGRDLLLLFSLENVGPRLRKITTLGYRPGSLALSPSRGHVLLGNSTGSWYEVRQTKTADAVGAVAGPDPFSAAFATLEDVDVLVSAPRAGRLEMMSLPDGDTLSQTETGRGKPFMLDNIVALGDGQTVALVGHPFLDGLTRRLVLTTRELQKGGQRLVDRMDSAIADPGNTDLGVGPCGGQDVLIYQGAPRRGAKEDPGKRGLTVRRLQTDEVLEQVPCERVVSARQNVMGTSHAVALAAEGGVDLLPRKALAAEKTFFEARAFSFDSDAGRFAIAAPDSQIKIVDLAKS